MSIHVKMNKIIDKLSQIKYLYYGLPDKTRQKIENKLHYSYEPSFLIYMLEISFKNSVDIIKELEND